MKSYCKLLICLVFAASGAVCSMAAYSAEATPVHARNAMVVSVNPLAAHAGVEIMKRGGNAIDAAVATGFTLAVVHPQAGNLGGGGFMLIRMADGQTHFLDYRETAPAAATHKMYLDARGNVIPDASLVGYKSIAVPGSVAGMVYAEKKWGKLPLAVVMAPAIRLARNGFALSHSDAQDLEEDKELANFPESKKIFLTDIARHGEHYEFGDIFHQPELARTLERIAQNPGSFYHGAIARQLAADIQNGGGLVTVADLAKYEVKERPVVRGIYRDMKLSARRPRPLAGL